MINGRTKIIGTVSTVSVVGIIAIFNLFTAPIKESIKEIKKDADKLEEKHNEDTKAIGGKLDKLLNFAQEQKTGQEVMKKDIQYMKQDIKEIKSK